MNNNLKQRILRRSHRLYPFSEEERTQILETIKVLESMFRSKVPNPHMLARMPEYSRAYFALGTLHSFFKDLKDPKEDYLKGEEEHLEQIHRLNECIERLAKCDARLDACNERLDKCSEKLDKLNG